MEEITKNFNDLNINTKIGLVYHPFCQKHSAEDSDPLSMSEFVEKERP
jgi:hypothetical protein